MDVTHVGGFPAPGSWRSGDPVVFIASGSPDSAIGHRARAFARRLGAQFQLSIEFRRGRRAGAAAALLVGLRRARPSIVYVFDVTVASVAAALAYRSISGCRIVLETGDAVADLLRSTGRLSRLGHRLVTGYERWALRSADAVVVRGTFHRSHLEAHGIPVHSVIQDGVDLAVFRPFDAAERRKALGLHRGVVVGVLGSLHWNRRLGWAPGLELIEALARVPDPCLRGLIVGEGSGRSVLARRAATLGVHARVRFVDGWTPLDQLPEYINCMDVCLSTQTNDVVGSVRTTGKLPLFLACGRFVLASRVGEASRVLPNDMLVDYAPGFDPAYPERLADRIHGMMKDSSAFEVTEQSRAIARREFDYDLLAPRLADVLNSVMRVR